MIAKMFNDSSKKLYSYVIPDNNVNIVVREG